MHNMEGLKQICESIGIVLREEQLQQFQIFYEMLVEKNKVMNLTGITELSEVIEKHFYDSLCLVKTIDLNCDACIIDVGTGAGFPGLPLKIVFPNLQVTLMDSLKKRLNFLDEVIAELRLTGIETLHGRAEDIGQNVLYREHFDYCVSRAVANLSTLSEYCLPLVKVGGAFVSFKSGEVEQELNAAKNAISLLGGGEIKIEEFCLPLSSSGRTLVKIEKIKNTSKRYPRKAGTPAKDPL